MAKNFQKEYKQRGKEKQVESKETTVVTITHQHRTESAPQQPAAPTAGDIGAQTLQQQRAKYALDGVKRALEDIKEEARRKDRSPDGQLKEFKSYAASFPAMIQMNGLGQAAAFYFSQEGTYRRLYDILSGWLTQEKQPYADELDLLAGITGKDMHNYRIAQVEALLLLDWVKRFAKAFVRED